MCDLNVAVILRLSVYRMLTSAAAAARLSDKTAHISQVKSVQFTSLVCMSKYRLAGEFSSILFLLTVYQSSRACILCATG